MSDEIIDSAIADAGGQPAAAIEQNEGNEVDVGTETNKDEQTEQPVKPEGEREPWPKTAQNALARRDKKLARMSRDYETLKRDFDQLREMVKSGGKTPDTEPNEGDFQSYSEYLLAKASHQTRKEIQEALKQNQPDPKVAEQEAWMEGRFQEIGKTANEVKKQIPDFVDTIDSYEFDDLPQNIQMLLLHAENPPLAAYNLIKSGRIDALASMPEAMAAAEILRAQANNPVRKVSQAPAPTTQARAVGAGKQSTESMSVEDVLKNFIRK